MKRKNTKIKNNIIDKIDITKKTPESNYKTRPCRNNYFSIMPFAFLNNTN
jgi:hypothetical protein